MARLDASRVAAWRELQSIGAAVERRIDEVLMAEWQVPLGWFDVLAALQRMGGRARPSELADELRLVALQPQPAARSARGGGLGGPDATDVAPTTTGPCSSS